MEQDQKNKQSEDKDSQRDLERAENEGMIIVSDLKVEKKAKKKRK